MIFTTNKPLKQWGRVLHDDDLGDAIVDRILERGRVLKLDGPSVRSRHVDPADLDGDSQLQQPAGISGINRQSFSEPTRMVEESRRSGGEVGVATSGALCAWRAGSAKLRHLVFLAALFGAVACRELYCPHMLTVVFLDASGAPLAPESVTAPERSELGVAPAVHSCAADGGAVCTSNRLTFDARTGDSISLYAVASTGEVFDGSVTPAWRASPLPNAACECHGDLATVDVVLRPP